MTTARTFSRTAGVALLVLSLTGLTSCKTLLASLKDDPPPARETEPDRREGVDTAAVRSFFDSSDLSPEIKDQAGFLLDVYEGYQRATGNLTAVEEYHLGRAFGAQVLSSHNPLDNARVNAYVNRIGQALARTSNRPDTYSGYRFLVLDSPEVNAFAAPGGFVFVTRGLVNLARNEAELAAVLAHEIGHIEQEHGLKAIRKDRLVGWAVGTAADVADRSGNTLLQNMGAAFEDSVTDLTKTIVNSGYSRETEFEADTAALRILNRAGYPPQALLSMLEALKSVSGPVRGGFGKTHPRPEVRIAEVKHHLGGKPRSFTVPSSQKRRYEAALGGL